MRKTQNDQYRDAQRTYDDQEDSRFNEQDREEEE